MNTIEQYIASLRIKTDPLIDEMEQFAKEHHVPIMDASGIETFIGLLRIQRPKFLLEIGSAIGYSAIRMAKACPTLQIVTVERDEERYNRAVHYIKESNVSDRIQIIYGDALLLEDEAIFQKTYDALFIDAAKGQYKRFFEKYAEVVAPGGVIYCDNLFMHGAVLQADEDIPRRNRTMIRNLKEFTKWMMVHPDYEVSILPIGDGILIAVKK
ncbi:SAM-dependent methyltransferase [Sporosarcina sp. HYO08]|nr:O-methyltransferase [Sporosarcina sp. HYO08]KXH87574.1 SAM-dependent methyltransferase [Sporosarcina sp. HYO08]